MTSIHAFIQYTLFKFIGIGCCFVALPLSLFAGELRIADEVIVDIDTYGTINRISSHNLLLANKGSLSAKKKSAGVPLYQGWGGMLNNKVKCEWSTGEMECEGSLISKEDRDTPQVDFKIRYKKEKDGVMSIHIETTTAMESEWIEPPYYYIALPISRFEDGQIAVESDKGYEKTYTVGSSPLTIHSYGSRAVTVTKDKQAIKVTAAEGAQVDIQDSRNWNGDHLRIGVSARRGWKASHPTAAGQKDIFEVTLSFKNEE